ncbi:MAG TPA: hypothetical protein VFZ73_13175 [Gemmatimonadaceae bacterium]
MTTDIMHQPTAEFRDYLEGEVTREFRRHRSFTRLRYAAVLLATLAAGTTAGLASAQIRQGAQRDSLLESAQSDLSLVALRLQLAQATVTDARSKVAAGVAGRGTLTAAEADLRQIEALAARAKLNVDEIRTTAMTPRDDLNAPVVGGRDFVSERLMLDLFTAQQRLTAAEEAQREAERQFRVGAVSELAVLDAGLRVTEARAALGTLAERQMLRKEFVSRGTPGEQLNRRFQQAQVRFDAHVASEAVKMLRQRLDAVRKQRAVGTASDLDVLRAEIQLKEREAELALLARQLRELQLPGQ